jgi:hypothetical protein
MKTKGLFSRYPRKISLLKDLAEGISGVFQLCKLLKTDSGLEIPSKISLLKDLADAFLGNFAYLRPAAGAFQLSKNWSCSLLFIEQLMWLSICYPSGNARSSRKKGRREAANEGKIITPGTDSCVLSPRIESLAPTLSAKDVKKGGAPRLEELGQPPRSAKGLATPPSRYFGDKRACGQPSEYFHPSTVRLHQ